MKCRGERNLCRLLRGSGGGYSIIVILLRDMNRADSLSSNQTLRTYCDTIAERWCQKIAATNYVPIKGAVVCQQLVELSIKAVRLLLVEPFEPDRAEEIGAGLAHIHYLQPEALGGTLQVVASHLLEGLDPDKGSALQSRLAEILGRLATGFFHQARQTIIQEQEERKAELSAEQERAKRELRINEIAVASSMNGIAMAGMEGTVTYANRSFLDMWGYDSVEEVLGRHILERGYAFNSSSYNILWS